MGRFIILNHEDGRKSIRNALLDGLSPSGKEPELSVRLVGGRLEIDGELPNVAAKRLILKRAADIPGVSSVVDRLHVAPVRPMADADIGDELLRALLDEPAFSILEIREKARGRTAVVRTPCKCAGVIEYEARDGVALLSGEVPGLGHKRLAGVIAWGVPGTRDVVNKITVMPTEEDSDEAILDAVWLALEKNAKLDSARLRVTVSDRAVTLAGHVSSEDAKERAERTAWYVDGVTQVVNRIIVRS